MILLHEESLDELASCPYLQDGREKQFRFFFATQLNKKELGHYLTTGWRKFGMYYFKPECPSCQACTPLRVKVDDFKKSKSLRQCWNKTSKHISVKISEPIFSDRAYEIYKKHCDQRFDQEAGEKEQFIESFYLPSAPMLQTNLYLKDELMGVGYLDISNDGLSSVYFAFDPEISAFSPGTYSILAEIECAKKMNLKYYYLGYWVDNCNELSYKKRFQPFEYYDWNQNKWLDEA